MATNYNPLFLCSVCSVDDMRVSLAGDGRRSGERLLRCTSKASSAADWKNADNLDGSYELTSAMVSACERLAAERMASGEDDRRPRTEPSNGSRSQGCPRFGSGVRFSSLLHVRLRAATTTDEVDLFRRASDRLEDDSVLVSVSIPSTGALTVCFSLSH